MTITRRDVIGIGGGILLAALPRRHARGADVVDVEMRGKDDGAHVWFDPIGIRVSPGQTLRWTNRDPANSHTTTSYHPAIFERPLRIPPGARPWDSDYLLPGQSFSVTFDREGVYDYYCVPHEHAGMVGRIVVGMPTPPAPGAEAGSANPVPEVALNAFPAVEEILAKGIVRRA